MQNIYLNMKKKKHEIYLNIKKATCRVLSKRVYR